MPAISFSTDDKYTITRDINDRIVFVGNFNTNPVEVMVWDPATNFVTFGGPVGLPVYIKASLPASATDGALARVSDDIRGIWAFSAAKAGWVSVTGVANVQDFGAVGDGATDDSTAIQNAINAAPTGGTVYLPAATYAVATGLTINGSQGVAKLAGSGSGADGSTTIKFTGTGAALTIGSAANPVNGFLVENLQVNVPSGQTGVRIFRSLRVHVRDVRVQLAGSGTAFELDGNGVQNYFNYLEHIEVTNTTQAHPYLGKGVWIHNEGNSNALISGVIQWVDTGIQIEKGTGTAASQNLVQATEIQHFETFGINLPASATGTGNIFINNAIENVGGLGTGINIADTTAPATFLLGNSYSGLATNLNDLSDNTAFRQTMQFDIDRQRFANMIFEYQAATGSRIRGQRWSRAAPSDQQTDVIGNPLRLFHAANTTTPGLQTNIDGSNNPFIIASHGLNIVTYSASMTPNATPGRTQRISATDGNAFTINNPTNSQVGDILIVMIRNTSGGALGAATFAAGYKLGAAWVQPANGFSRSIQFLNDGTNWVEVSRAAADVAN